MPVNCKFCETNTHSEGYPSQCNMTFISTDEALHLIEKNGLSIIQGVKTPTKREINLEDIISLIKTAEYKSCDKKVILSLLNTAEYIEVCDPKSEARKMQHGIAMYHSLDKRYTLIKTNEHKLRWFEMKFNLR